jgi:hypothetical protein
MPLALDLPETERAVLAAHLLGSLPSVLHDEDEGIAGTLRRDAEFEANPSLGMSLEEPDQTDQKPSKLMRLVLHPKVGGSLITSCSAALGTKSEFSSSAIIIDIHLLDPDVDRSMAEFEECSPGVVLDFNRDIRRWGTRF